MVRIENKLVKKAKKDLNKTIKVAFKTKRTKNRILKKDINELNIATSQTLKTKR